MRAYLDHLREGALGDDAVPPALAGNDDGQALADEIVRDLVELAGIEGKTRRLTRGNDGGIERIVDARLQGSIEIGIVQDARRFVAARFERAVQCDNARGERSRLVGAEHIHAAQILDRFQAPDDDALARHHAGAGGKGDADDGGQQFGREADRKGHGEEKRFDDRPTQQQIDRQHEEDDDDNDADEKEAEMADAALEFRLRRLRLQASGNGAEGGAGAGFRDQHPGRAAPDRGAEENCIAAR